MSQGIGEDVAVVTGASGFIATELVAQLLAKGYTVRGTVRDPANKTKVAHLEALGAAFPGKLTLHAADLLKPGSFDEVLQGATVIHHTASPVILKSDDPVKQLIEPAVQGTKTVLEAAVANKSTVRRVVLTSSVAAILKQQSGPDNKEIYTDRDWNTDATLESSAYAVSKTRAEQAAWEIARANGLSLVTILPTYVVGPVISSRADSPIVNMVVEYLEGRKEEPLSGTSYVDVRDVARAHILAAEVPSASGRYLLSHPDAFQSADIAAALSAAFPNHKFPPGKHEKDAKPLYEVSRTSKDLGLAWTSPYELFVDMARTLFALGVAKPVPK